MGVPRCALNRLLVVVLLFCHVTQCLRSLCLSDSLCHCALTRLLAFCPLGSLSLSYFCFAMPLSQFSTFSALTVHLCSDCAPVSLCICCLCTPFHCASAVSVPPSHCASAVSVPPSHCASAVSVPIPTGQVNHIADHTTSHAWCRRNGEQTARATPSCVSKP